MTTPNVKNAATQETRMDGVPASPGASPSSTVLHDTAARACDASPVVYWLGVGDVMDAPIVLDASSVVDRFRLNEGADLEAA